MNKPDTKRSAKPELHPRNPHRARYDFPALIADSPDLQPFIRPNRFGNESIDFGDAAAVKALNRALLKHFYGVAYWDLPAGFLCPPIPGRADYIHYLADLLATSNDGSIPRGPAIKALDIGIGANCIYPIIGTREYGWRFVGSDINTTAIAAAKTLVSANPCLAGKIEARLQDRDDRIFAGIWRNGERFDITLCNPPFHSSKAAMTAESNRKWRGLKHGKASAAPKLNFGGQANELWCDGGEEAFVCRMVRESRSFGERCCWFSSLVARQSSLSGIYRELKKAGAAQVRTVEMAQGQKISRFVTWSYLGPEQREAWRAARWKG
ncbi:23S rRNA (adenine(1618)-N(6))-methyltransferase RlmF [Marinobacterium aestuariivivens]|uniref:Ribosomal RNA large subunit methyltransferase F n=1 Tax=Marinobacterium aestuariivivens TaxID=1698799 RepID=A0ABW2A313_9GAMM